MGIIPRQRRGECFHCEATLEEAYFGELYWSGGNPYCHHITVDAWLDKECEEIEDHYETKGVEL